MSHPPVPDDANQVPDDVVPTLDHPAPGLPDTPPAGWYPDPDGKPMNRYWDGAVWTDQFAAMGAPAGTGIGPRVTVDQTGHPVSPSSRLVAMLLCLFLGPLGIHRFYVGKIGTGILQLVTFGGLGIWAIVDLIMIIVGAFRDKAGRLLLNW